MTYEPVAAIADATEEQKRLVTISDTIVQAFVAGRVDECVAAIGLAEEELGPNRFTMLYREQVESLIRSGRSGNVDGLIVFIEK